MSDTQPDNPRAVIGGNAPPILDQLKVVYAPLEQEVAETLGEARGLPEKVESDEDVKAYAVVNRVVHMARSKIEVTRQKEKAPFINAERAVDGYFVPMRDKLDTTKAVLAARTKVYQDQKDEEARQAARAAADRARAEEAAQMAAAAAAVRQSPTASITPQVAAADAAQRLATAADQQANVKPAENVRVRSEQGPMATSQQFWTYAVTDWAAVPCETLWPFIPEDVKLKAISAFVKAGGRTLPGVKIYQETRAVFR